MTPVMIVPLPCGCATDADKLGLWTLSGKKISIDAKAPKSKKNILVECPWCAAVFFFEDWREWYASGGVHYLWMQRGPKKLLDVGPFHALELLRECDCGAPIVRMRDGSEVHMAPEVESRVLWN